MKSISSREKLDYDFTSPFVFDSRQSILKSKDLGIVNGHMAIGVPDESVCAVAGLYAPPYVSSNFYMDVRFMGETVRPESYVWLPNAICREGNVNGVAVTALTALGDGMRSGVIQCRLQNTTSSRQSVPVQIRLGGGLDYSGGWELHPLVCKELDKTTILHYLHCDLSRSFAFMPVHGQPFGPWYPVNQEKIVTLIYYYVKHTGDTAFLSEADTPSALSNRKNPRQTIQQRWKMRRLGYSVDYREVPGMPHCQLPLEEKERSISALLSATPGRVTPALKGRRLLSAIFPKWPALLELAIFIGYRIR